MIGIIVRGKTYHWYFLGVHHKINSTQFIAAQTPNISKLEGCEAMCNANYKSDKEMSLGFLADLFMTFPVVHKCLSFLSALISQLDFSTKSAYFCFFRNTSFHFNRSSYQAEELCDDSFVAPKCLKIQTLIRLSNHICRKKVRRRIKIDFCSKSEDRIWETSQTLSGNLINNVRPHRR